MSVLSLAAQAAVAAVLLVGGGAKAADLAGFAAAMRLLVPPRVPGPVVRALAVSAAGVELALGEASLPLPAAGWLNAAVLALACGFAGVSGLGYARHRGRACHCFGALSGGRFDARGLLRSAAVAVAAAIATAGPPPGTARLGAGQQALLGLAGAVVALSAFTAARALAQARRRGLEVS